MPLRWKIVLYSSTLLLALVAAVLLYVNYQAEQFVNQGIASDLHQGSERIRSLEEERLASLRLTAGLVASFPDLKALLATDVSTIRDFLVSYQRQNRRSELLIVLDPTGRVLARTDTPAAAVIEDPELRWIRPLLAGQNATGVLAADSGVYHAAAMPAEAGGTVFGFVIAGARLDTAFARSLRDFVQSEVVICEDRILGSTLPEASLPWRSREQWHTAEANRGEQQALSISGESYLALATNLGTQGGPRPLAILLKSHDRVLEPYRRIRTGLLVLLLLAAVVGISGSVLLARTLIAPVAKLVEGTKQVAAGNLDFRLDIQRKDEIGVLAQSFDLMISERKRLEEQFRQSQKMEAVGRLAGGVAHDFNNLVTAISGYAQLALNGLKPGDPLRGDIEEVIKAGQRAATLTRQLLAFSRRQVLTPKVLDLNSVVADTEKLLRRLIGADIELVTILDPALGRVQADLGQIEQVIMNLVVNARDAMPKGGRLSIETVNLDVGDFSRGHPGLKAGRYVVLTVRDTGTGMDAEVRSHLFEPFFTTKEKGKGTGLGLATVYGIVQQSNGHLLVDSEPGWGSAFHIYLPRTDDAVEPEKARRIPTQKFEGVETLLLVEDERPLRELASRILRARGYTVLEASNGSEALQICQHQTAPIQLVITDIVMPQMNGYELAEQLALLRSDLKVLFVSGYAERPDHAAVDLNHAFLQKPFTPDMLVGKVREVLDSPPGNQNV